MASNYALYKTGKKPATPSASDFMLRDVLKAEMPTAPKRFGFGLLYSDWGMLGNDAYGDCAWAGPAHETMLFNKIRHGRDVVFTTATVLGDYASTGFDPATGNNDNGTDCRQMMGYRRSTGLLASDFSGRHKIDAYVSIDPKDWDTIVRAIHTFGAVGLGFEVPDTSAFWNQLGDIWTVTDKNAPIEGGHYVPGVGSIDSPNECSVITWGKRQRMSREFFETYNDELWVPLSLEIVRGGFGLNHLDVPTLKRMLASL